MIPRVENSDGPFFSSPEENSRRNSVGKRVAWIPERWLRARDVVKSALRHVRVWCMRVSSCSSLGSMSAK